MIAYLKEVSWLDENPCLTSSNFYLPLSQLTTIREGRYNLQLRHSLNLPVLISLAFAISGEIIKYPGISTNDSITLLVYT